MVKFMHLIGDKMLDLLDAEAKKRDVTVQKLVRAIIMPEWIDRHTKSSALPPNSISYLWSFVLSACKTYEILPTIDS